MTQNCINDQQVVSMSFQIISTTGIYTPPSNLIFAIVEMLGGGAGSRSENSASIRVGAPGSACSYRVAGYTRAQLAPSVSITIGAGGTASNNGGTTSFGAVLAVGGTVGGSSSGAGPSAGAASSGLPSGGNMNSRSYGTNWGWAQIIGANRVGQSTNGGSSLYGGGAPGIAFDTAAATAVNGTNAQGFGAGASGGYTANSGGNTTGGTGSPGVILITEFLGS